MLDNRVKKLKWQGENIIWDFIVGVIVAPQATTILVVEGCEGVTEY